MEICAPKVVRNEKQRILTERCVVGTAILRGVLNELGFLATTRMGPGILMQKKSVNVDILFYRRVTLINHPLKCVCSEIFVRRGVVRLLEFNVSLSQ